MIGKSDSWQMQSSEILDRPVHITNPYCLSTSIGMVTRRLQRPELIRWRVQAMIVGPLVEFL